VSVSLLCCPVCGRLLSVEDNAALYEDSMNVSDKNVVFMILENIWLSIHTFFLIQNTDITVSDFWRQQETLLLLF
jgi:pantothenate kinase-related protein Tda10